MSTLKVDTIKDTNNVEVYTCKAWVNFDGTQAAADMIRESGNVSSITDNGTGDYTVSFTTAMSDANYCVSTSVGPAPVSNGGAYTLVVDSEAGVTTSSVRVQGHRSTVGYRDFEICSVAIFR